MSFDKEKAKREKFQNSQLPAIRQKQAIVIGPDPKADARAILRLSAKNFKDLLNTMENSSLPMKKIHKFNSTLAGIGDRFDLTPEEMLCALTLLAKYIAMHSNLSGGVRVNNDMPLWALPAAVDKLVVEANRIPTRR